MKLHLPSSLRKALLAVMAAAAAVSAPAWGSIMHSGATLLTYTDFGSNMGRYTIYQQNELLQYLNSDEQGGIKISYTYGDDTYKLEHGMISYESMVDGGPFTAIAYNATATVQHNGVTNPVFTGRFIGSDQAIHYAGIEYRSCTDNKFLLTPEIDYKITRLSKIVTDITPTSVFDTKTYLQGGGKVEGMLQYRAGGGYMQQADEQGNTKWLAGAYAYVVGGVLENRGFNYNTGFNYVTGEGTKTDGRGIVDDSYTVSILGVKGWDLAMAGTETHPLPFVTQGGDSGSPVWVWNASTKSYELISCHQARGGYDSYSRGASEWTKKTLESYDKAVTMDDNGHEVHLKAVDIPAAQPITATANGNTEISITPYCGRVTTADGTEITKFVGVKNGLNTWADLYALKDDVLREDRGVQKTIPWYSYGNEYLNANNTHGLDLEYADLFMTENLVFKSAGQENNRIILDADVDLGIGYAQFTNTTGSGKASFTITSGSKAEGDRDFNFNHAGYIVDANTEVRLQIANREMTGGYEYFREWRKTGEGDLYLEGKGDNYVFLNVGGKGTTYLQQQEGYAAYNVLINNGATVNLDGDKTQVERDVTFGYGGGTLDLAGAVTMDWYQKADAAADGFTINALTQDATIANTKAGTTATLTYRETGNTTFLGSFQDIKADGAAGGTLEVVYDGGNGSTWTLNSIHTKLSGESGLEVKTGTVVLVGTNTEHAQGSLNGYNANRYTNKDDWHYADAKMNVTVDSNATFELGSHARLDGSVTVQDNGTFVMREGVRHQMEYIEGWYFLEDTYKIDTYYGLKGNVVLNGTAQMQVAFDAATDANTTYAGCITGTGSMTVDTAGGSLTLKGTNDFTGAKTVTRGTLVLDDTQAAGNTKDSRWKLEAAGVLKVHNASAQEGLDLVDNASTGVLALTRDETGTAINLNERTYRGLIIGAAAERVDFGAKGTTDTYEAVEGKWNLGGGGGNLVVNYALQGGHTLVLGNSHTTGSVTLANKDNKIGAIDFAGKVTLDYESVAALGDAAISLGYTNRIMGSVADTENKGTLELLGRDSAGVMLIDRMGGVQSIDLTDRKELRLGVSRDTTYSGTFQLGVVHDAEWNSDTCAYKFGGSTATLTLTQGLANWNGVTTQLIVDGEGYSGGVLELKEVATITGTVRVSGYDYEYAEQGLPTGNATLRLSVDEALADCSWIDLYGGGVLDINGTEQTLHYLSASEGGSIIDSSADRKGRLNLNANGMLLLDAGTVIDVGTITVQRVLENSEYSEYAEIALACTSNYDTMEITGGTVAVTSPGALCATGLTTLENGSVLEVTGVSVATQLEMRGSTLKLDENASFGGSIKVMGTGDARNTIQADGTATISAVLDVEEGAVLDLRGSTIKLSATVMNDSNGLVNLQARELQFGNSEGISIGGVLDLQGNGSGAVKLYNTAAANNMVVDIKQLVVHKDAAVTLDERTWNTIWNLHSLTGEGSVTWDSRTNHWYSSRLVLDGANGFEGTVLARRLQVDTAGRDYSTYVELAHDQALQHAALSLEGKAENGRTSYMALAVNTANATLKGLNGNGQTVMYAGAAVEGESTAATPLKSAPDSVRSATLTVTGSDDYTFAGNVQGGQGGRGVSVVMNGTGSQSFSGAHVHLVNVAVDSGTLKLTDADTLEISGNVRVSSGATLDMAGKTLVLGSGQQLGIMQSAAATASAARLTGDISFSGGSLLFSGAAVAAASATVLELDGHAAFAQDAARSLTVSFAEEHLMQADHSYHLSSGDWSTVQKEEIATGAMIYYDAAFTTSNQGLDVSFTRRSDIQVWDGAGQKNLWDGRDFGQSESRLDETETAVFNDMAGSTEVAVAGNVEVKEMVFDNDTKLYSVSAQDGAGVVAGSLRQVGDATTTLADGVTITGVADVLSGTLVLQEGSSTGDATVSAGASVLLESAGSVTGSVSGEGELAIGWGTDTTGSVRIGESGIGSLAVQSGTLDLTAGKAPQGSISALSVQEQGTVVVDSLNVLEEGSVAKVDGKLSLALGRGAKNIVTIDAESAGTVELRTGEISYLSELGGATLALDGGTKLMFAENNGSKVSHFDNDILLLGDAELRVYGTNYHNSVTINGDVSGDYRLKKWDGNQTTEFTGKVALAELRVESGTVFLNGSDEEGRRNQVDKLTVVGNAATAILNTDIDTVAMANSVEITANEQSADSFSLLGEVVVKANDKQGSITGTGGARIENALIDLKEGARVEMVDITLATNSRITDAAATLVSKGMKVEAQVGSNLTQKSDMVLSSGLQMLTYGDTHTACTAAQGSKVVQFTLDNIEDVSIEGTSFVITLVGMGGTAFDNYDWVSVELTGGAVFSSTLPICLEYTDAQDQVKQLTGYYSAVDQGQDTATAVHNLVYFNLAEEQVPEPASSTLSLLALAALAARRRRK